jgi:hypothetical protein
VLDQQKQMPITNHVHHSSILRKIMPLFINSAVRKEYVKNLNAFASLKEALPLGDKVIFAASARLLDPYEGTTPESRRYLLNNLPKFEFNTLKRILVIAMTNFGHTDDQDKALFEHHLLHNKLKPLEPYLHENNQSFIIKEDLLSSYKDALSETPKDGYELIYNDDMTIPFHLKEHFFEKARLINDEQATHHEMKNLILEHGYYNQMLQTGMIFFCGSIYLKAAVKTKLITQSEATDFANEQLKLIEGEIHKAFARKNKSERSTTSLLTVYKGMYIDYLKSVQSA